MSACTGPSREVTCSDSSVCIRSGEQGTCLMPEGYCAFEDADCTSGMRWDSTAGDDLAGECVGATGSPDGGAADAGMNACGGQTQLEAEPGTPCGACMTGSFECSGMNAVVCQGAVSLSVPIASEGAVSATSVFGGNDYPAILARDGDFTTSWFDGYEPVTKELWVEAEPEPVRFELQEIAPAEPDDEPPVASRAERKAKAKPKRQSRPSRKDVKRDPPPKKANEKPEPKSGEEPKKRKRFDPDAPAG